MTGYDSIFLLLHELDLVCDVLEAIMIHKYKVFKI